MSWALEEFYSAVEDEFGVELDGGNAEFLDTPAAVIDYVTEQTEAVDDLSPEEYREHVASVIGELMARTLGVTRYSEGSRFVEDLHVR
jgi:hypothetical protein